MENRPSLLTENPVFELIVQASPAGMIIADTEGKIVLVNPQALEWFGYTEAELVGQAIEILLPKSLHGAHMTHRARYMNHTAPRPMAKGRDLYGQCKDGSMFPVDISLHPICNGTEKLILANILDATPRQQAQRVPKERLAAIGEMVTGLAHESRNALQRARGCLDLLELDLEEGSEQIDLTKRIRRSLEDLERNYEEVRNYAAPILLNKVYYSLGKLLEETFDDLKFEGNEVGNHQLTIDVRPGTEDNYVDKHRMKQVFRNILENAMAASEPESEIAASVETIEIEGQKWQRLEILDSGSGMAPDIVSRVFDPFFTTKQSGTGLGLAICRRIIDAHAGQISASNVTGKGVCIRIELPLIRARDL